jgi:MoxR-like ATPase
MTKLYFHPVNGDWLPDFKRTVETPLDLSDAVGLPAELDHLDQARIWGTPYEIKKERYHEDIEPDDLVLFSQDGRFFAAGRIQHAFRSREFGKWAWDNEDSELVYTLTDFEEISIPTNTITDLLGYSGGYRVQGFTRPTSERLQELRSEFGSLNKAFKALKTEYTPTSVDGGQETLVNEFDTQNTTDDELDVITKDPLDDNPVTETAPYYWVNQSHEELEAGYLQAPRTSFPNYDLQKLKIDDIVFNYVDGEIVGYSEVTQPAYLVEDEDEEKRRVDIDVHLFDEPLQFVDVFTYLWREDVRLEKYYPINRAGVNQQYLFNLSEKAGDYLLERGKDSNSTDDLNPLANPDHPLITHIQDPHHSVYKVTSPPDYWLTAYLHAAVGLENKDKHHWSDIDAGDVLIFHSRASPSRSELADQQSCILGAGIVRAKTTKSEDDMWWYDESNESADSHTFSNLITFERLYLTGDFNVIDHTQTIPAKAPAEINADLDALTTNALDFEEVDSICNRASDSGFPRHRAIEPLGTSDDNTKALAIADALADHLEEIPPVALHKSFTGDIANNTLDGLYFPNNHGEAILAQIEGALRSGKHVIFTGPPGTGKTEIAHRVAKHLAEQYPYLYTGSQLTTATSDWSTFDTVGGYMPTEDDTDSGNNLEFTPGLVLNRFKSRRTNTQKNDSLVIDELNRADIDKAFGQLFTVLSGQSVQLPYTKDGEEVDLAPANGNALSKPHEYRIPESWILFATLNTYDKTSLYEMSYAFMRRFAFIRVPEPDIVDLDDSDLLPLLNKYTDAWGVHTSDFDVDHSTPLLDVGHVWQAANGAIDDRAIGPAVVKDIIAYLIETTALEWEQRLTQAVISYILPQLEGVPKRKQVVTELAAVDRIDKQLLDTAARDMLQVSVIKSDG